MGRDSLIPESYYRKSLFEAWGLLQEKPAPASEKQEAGIVSRWFSESPLSTLVFKERTFVAVEGIPVLG